MNEHRWFEGEWACTTCGQPFAVKVGCLCDEDGTPYASVIVAVEDHCCDTGEVVIMRGDGWTPLREDIPDLPTWEEMSPS